MADQVVRVDLNMADRVVRGARLILSESGSRDGVELDGARLLLDEIGSRDGAELGRLTFCRVALEPPAFL